MNRPAAFHCSEFQEHIIVADALRLARLLWCHVANGEVRDKRLAAKLKVMGLSPGVPDILIFTPPPMRPGLVGTAIELKAKAGRVSPDQLSWGEGLAATGWAFKVCYGADDALAFLAELGYRIPIPSGKAQTNYDQANIGARLPKYRRAREVGMVIA